METECRLPSRKRTCQSFDIRVLCRMHERRARQNWSVVNLDSLSLSSLHWKHCIRSILLRVADTSKVHPFQYSWEIRNLNDPCPPVLKIDRTCCDASCLISRPLEAMAVYSGRGWPWEIVERSYNLHRPHHPELTTGSWCSSLLASRTATKLSN